MASENLAKLQATTNRFAGPVNFSPLAIDGGMGEKTESAVTAVLQFISGGCGGQCAGPSTQAAADTALVDINPSTIMQNVLGINQLFVGAAEVMSLEPAANVALVKQPTGGSLPDKGAFKVAAPPGSGALLSAKIWWRQLSVPAKAGVAGAGILAVIGGWSMVKKKKAG